MSTTDNPWLGRRILAYAHQGGALEAPSSTLYAIERAIGLGVTGIELDVHMTNDGALVVCHDMTLDRTTNGSGAIADRSLVELRALDAAANFVDGRGAVGGRPEAEYALRGRAPGDPRLSVATLDEALEASAGVMVNLDIKNGPPAVAGYEAEIAVALRRHGRGDDVIVTSFDDHRTQRFSELAPEFGTSPGVSGLGAFVQAVRRGERPASPGGRHVALQVPSTFAGTPLVDAALVDACHEAGVACHVWTVDDEAEMRSLAGLGVDGIMSDCPSILVALLANSDPGGSSSS